MFYRTKPAPARHLISNQSLVKTNHSDDDHHVDKTTLSHTLERLNVKLTVICRMFSSATSTGTVVKFVKIREVTYHSQFDVESF